MEDRENNEIDLIVTDFQDTIYSDVHPEIFLGKYTIEEMMKDGDLEKTMKCFFDNGLKGFLKFRKRRGSTHLLENLGYILEGQDRKIIEDFKENYDSSKMFNQFLNSLRGENGDSKYYLEGMDMFSRISEDVETMIYSQSLEELIDFHLSEDNYIENFTEGIVGNRIKTSEEGKIIGIDWKVDGPDIEPEEQKIGLLDVIDSRDYDPSKVAYIDDEKVGILNKLKEEGGRSILSPTSDYSTKKLGVKNDIYTPKTWQDVEKYLGF